MNRIIGNPKKQAAAERAMRPRLTVVQTVYFAVPNEHPMSVDSRYNCEVDSQEQPWMRRLTIGEEWAPLEGCWLKQCSELVLINEEGKSFLVQPTEAERADIRLREILVRMGGTLVSTVRPGRSVRLAPPDIADVLVRCLHKGAKATIVVFPS